MKHLPLIAAILIVAGSAYFFFSREPEASTDPPTSAPVPSAEPQAEIAEPVVIVPALPTPKPVTPPKTDPAPPTHDYYTKGKQSRDGIGKFYQGREIAYVMGHQAISWLERRERESEEAPAKAINLIELGENEVLADIGAGSGYYSLRIAMKNPKAKVIGVDIQPEMITFLKGRAEQLDITNLSTQLSTIENITLPAASINAALMVDAYHEFSHPYEMMTSLVTALKPGGRLYLLEYREEDPTVNIKPLHKMSQAQAIKEMKLVGLTWEKTIDDLPWQHFMVFRKP